MKKTGKKCLECSGDMYAIQIIDRGQMNIHYNFAYSMDDFKKKPRVYTISGFVSAEACELCGRIAFRTVPKE